MQQREHLIDQERSDRQRGDGHQVVARRNRLLRGHSGNGKYRAQSGSSPAAPIGFWTV